MWSKNYDKCIDCGRKKLKHRARGLCATCYYRFVYCNDELRTKRKIKKHLYYLKKKDDPKTRELNRLRIKKYKGSPKFKKIVEKEHTYNRFMRFLAGRKKLKRYENGITIVIDGNKIKTPIIPPKSTISESNDIYQQVEIFKKAYKNTKQKETLVK